MLSNTKEVENNIKRGRALNKALLFVLSKLLNKEV